MWAVTEPDFDAELTGAQGTGLATMAGGTVLDTWFPAPRLIPAQPADGTTRLSAAEAAAERSGRTRPGCSGRMPIAGSRSSRSAR